MNRRTGRREDLSYHHVPQQKPGISRWLLVWVGVALIGWLILVWKALAAIF